MVEAGLLVAGDDIPVPYDRFRDRVMFPIADVRGRVIAFGGRALEKDVPAKYLNSPETPLFHKGDNLYNLSTARQATHNGSPLIVVEGYVDVIAMVTSASAARSRRSARRSPKTSSRCSGRWRTSRSSVSTATAPDKRPPIAPLISRCPLLPGKSLRFALLPEGQDPDDLARSGGRGAIEEVIAAARPLSDMIWSREIEGGSFATPERRAALEARIGELSNGIRDEVVRRYYREDLAERLQRTFAPEGRPWRLRQRQFPGPEGQRITPPICPAERLQPGPARPIRPPGGADAGRGRGQVPGSPRALPGGQPPTRDRPNHAWPAQRDVPPRGVDFAIPH